MKALYPVAAGLFFAAVSCERHSWESTRALSEEHGHAEHAEHADHEGGADDEHAGEAKH